MPCFNARTHLPKSIGSVLAQTFQDWELIAVDDGSGDGTLAWLQDQADPRIRPLHQSNAGASAARNLGLGAARGDYIAFLDADDTWAPTFLEKMLAALEARPDAVLAYCGWQNLGLIKGDGPPFVPPDYETPDKLETLFAGCRWPIHGALTRHEAIKRAGGFLDSLDNAEDYHLWLEVATTAPIVRVAEVLAYYHFHDATTQKSLAAPAQAALNHVMALQFFLADHADLGRRLGRRTIRRLTYGHLLQKAYELYWRRNLPAARTLFRRVMRGGYGNISDWKYMLLSLLPEAWHRALIKTLGTKHGH